jgi:hypothetical protein
MAEVLIKLEPADNPDDPLAWGRLHPVVVKPDGWAWGTAEGLPKFCVLRITDMTPEEVEPYLEPDEIDDAISLKPRKIRRAIRKWRFDIDDVAIPLVLRNQVKKTGYAQVTRVQIVSYIKRVING